MNKLEKQFNLLQKRGINVSKERFTEYYNVTRQARAKLNRLEKTKDTNNLLRNRSISNNVEFIRKQVDFEKAFKSRKMIIQKDFISKDNVNTRKSIARNLHKSFGYSKKVNNLIIQLNKLSAKDLKKFMNENKDLYPLLWYADKDLIEKLDYSFKDVQSRLSQFMGGDFKKLHKSIDDDSVIIKKPKVKKRKQSRRKFYEDSLAEIRKLNPDLFKK